MLTLSDRPYYPALIIAAILIFGFGLLNLLQIFFQKDLYYVDKLWLGADYSAFYCASKHILQGESPYCEFRYLCPPIPAYLNLIAALCFNKKTAFQLAYFASIFFVLCAYLCSAKVFFNTNNRNLKGILLLGLSTILYSYPFYFLIDRGNSDGIVAFLLVAGLLLLKKNQYITGCLWAIAASIKVYPLLLIAPLLIARKFKVIFGFAAMFVMLILLCPHQWWEYVQTRLFQRIDVGGVWFRSEENGSIVCTTYYLVIAVQKMLNFVGVRLLLVPFFKQTAMILYASMLFIMILADWRLVQRSSTIEYLYSVAGFIFYFPYMVAVPTTSYHYTLIT